MTNATRQQSPLRRFDLERDCHPKTLRAFMAKVETAPNGCWLWTAAVYPDNGYGNFRCKRAHRVAYELFVGPLLPGMVIDHTCHNDDPSCPGGLCSHRLCVRPDHLRQITNEENFRAGRLGSGSLKGTGQVGGWGRPKRKP